MNKKCKFNQNKIKKQKSKKSKKAFLFGNNIHIFYDK